MGAPVKPQLAAHWLLRIPLTALTPQQQETIFRLVNEAYQSRDKKALPLLATVHEEGCGTPVNLYKAAEYARQAADENLISYDRSCKLYHRVIAECGTNNAEAYYQLGLFYAKGSPGIPKNISLATQFQQKSSDLYHRGALYYLSKFLLEPLKYPENHLTCIRNFEKIVELDSTDEIAAKAFYLLGTL